MKSWKLVLILFVIAGCCCGAIAIVFVKKFWPMTHVPLISQPTPKRVMDSLDGLYLQRYDDYYPAPDTASDVLVGTSLTEAFPIAILHDRNAINRGIPGNNAELVAGRIPFIADLHPHRIFLEVGANDINNHDKVDSFISDFSAIIKLIRERSPRTKIYVISPTPVCGPFEHNAILAHVFFGELQKYCLVERLPFIDIYHPLGGLAGLKERFTVDGLHLTFEGYTVWAQELRKYLSN